MRRYSYTKAVWILWCRMHMVSGYQSIYQGNIWKSILLKGRDTCRSGWDIWIPCSRSFQPFADKLIGTLHFNQTATLSNHQSSTSNRLLLVPASIDIRSRQRLKQCFHVFLFFPTSITGFPTGASINPSTCSIRVSSTVNISNLVHTATTKAFMTWWHELSSKWLILGNSSGQDF